MSSEVVYTMYRADKFYGPDRQVLSNISLSFLHGAKIGVLGPNGAGKSTLLRIMAGLEEPSSGVAELDPKATVGFLPQEPELDPAKDVRGNVEDGVRDLRDLLDRFNAVSAAFAEPDADFDALLAEQADVQDRIDRADAWSLDQHLDRAMDALRLPDGDRDVTTLSGGERRRVALCRLLLSAPDLLLLDEPTNHLDAESVAWLERHLESYKGTVMAVTHDRYFLDNVAGWILELDRGKGIPFQGNYSSWLEQKEARLGVEEKQNAARRRTLQRELEWVRMSPTARHAKSKARLTAYEKLLAADQATRWDMVEIHIPAGPRLGDVVVRAEHVQKGFGDRLLVEDLTFDLPPGGIVGVIGPNGAGKTTLFRMIAGEEQPDGGSLEVGDTVELAYVDQSRGALEGTNTVWKEISGNQDVIQLGKREVNSRQYVSWFNFRGGDQQKLVKDLSGGERNRVHLAKLLRSGGNLLLLDEPTNDLDVDTLRALEEALLDFAGCAVVISHDRWFLDRVATHMLAFEGDSQATWFEGSYGRVRGLGPRDARPGGARAAPHRLQAARPADIGQAASGLASGAGRLGGDDVAFLRGEGQRGAFSKAAPGEDERPLERSRDLAEDEGAGQERPGARQPDAGRSRDLPRRDAAPGARSRARRSPGRASCRRASRAPGRSRPPRARPRARVDVAWRGPRSRAPGPPPADASTVGRPAARAASAGASPGRPTGSTTGRRARDRPRPRSIRHRRRPRRRGPAARDRGVRPPRGRRARPPRRRTGSGRAAGSRWTGVRRTSSRQPPAGRGR